MAEGDTIARLAARLHRRLAGSEVTASHFAVAALATADLTGHRLVEVASRGKHLLFRFGPAGRRPALSLHLHLRMDGSLAVRTRAPRLGGDVRLVVAFTDGVLVGDKVPVVDLVATAHEARVVGHLGPDLCAPGWGPHDAAEGVRRLEELPGRPMVEALLDQRNLAGIGNLYAVEGCYLSGVWPWTPVGLVTARLPAMVDLEHRMLAAGVAGSGQATTGDRRRGHSHWVYGRKDRPCRRCGTAVRFWPGDGGPATRPTWWCPHCQPVPAGVPPVPGGTARRQSSP